MYLSTEKIMKTCFHNTKLTKQLLSNILTYNIIFWQPTSKSTETFTDPEFRVTSRDLLLDIPAY